MVFLYLYILFTFGVWLRRAVLMLGSIRRYSCIPELPWDPSRPQPKVSVVVPCRNEEHNLTTLIPSLLAQDYPNIELLFLNDRSTDRTLELLESAAKKDKRIRVLNGKALPEGWTGKNHALHQLAQAAAGRWILETDADTEHHPHSVSSSVRYAEERGLDLLTLSAKCVCGTFGEHLVQPMGIGCFSVWFRLEKVNDPASGTPLACGQYLLIKKEAYNAVGGNERVKADVTEDLAVFRNVKAAGLKCELAIGAHLFSTRMYRNFKESWIGWRRIYLHALQKNVPSLVSKIAMLVVFSFAPFLVFAVSAGAAIGGHPGAAGVALASGGLCGFILFLRSRSHTALKADQWSILLHPVSALVIAAILVDCLHHHFAGKKVVWKQQKY